MMTHSVDTSQLLFPASPVIVQWAHEQTGHRNRKEGYAWTSTRRGWPGCGHCWVFKLWASETSWTSQHVTISPKCSVTWWKVGEFGSFHHGKSALVLAVESHRKGDTHRAGGVKTGRDCLFSMASSPTNQRMPTATRS
jgi:hypothetical protein